PTIGTLPMTEAPMPRPQYASWSKRSTCPVKAMPRVQRNKKQPLTHVSSRGYLYAPNKNVCTRCKLMMATMKMEPQLWTARKNAPRNCWLLRYCRLGHASFAEGTYTRAKHVP